MLFQPIGCLQIFVLGFRASTDFSYVLGFKASGLAKILHWEQELIKVP
jgi:hypothetical protein